MPLLVGRGHFRGVSYLGEKRCPDRLDFGDVSSLDERSELVGLEAITVSQLTSSTSSLLRKLPAAIPRSTVHRSRLDAAGGNAQEDGLFWESI